MNSLIDSHCHLTKQFLDNPAETIQRARDNGVGKMICVGTNLEDSKEAIQIAQDFEGVYASVGIHPEENFQGSWDEFEKLINQPKVVAIGETGLDYKVGLPGPRPDRGKQIEIFEKQISLAGKYNRPLIIHIREAQEELMRILDSRSPRGEAGQNDEGLSGVFHCFSGDQRYLEFVLEKGFYVSFAGNLTFKNAESIRELAKLVPLDKILVETDSPFLSPEPLRGKQNEPANVKIVAQFLANLKGVSLGELEKITSSNAIQLFNL